MQSGFLLIDKPVDWTSHDVVGCIRAVVRAYARKHGSTVKPKNIRVGHAGTLDPFATGLLIVGVGRDATRRIDEFKGMPKEYIATVTLGATSDTQDLTGTLTQVANAKKHITKTDVETVLQQFLGKQKQIPPMYSAKKVGGKKLYELAREGKTIERAACEIEIFDIELTNVIARRTEPCEERRGNLVCNAIVRLSSIFQKNFGDTNNEIATSPEAPRNDRDIDSFTIRVSCSTGTYIRTLAHDIGAALGTGAYCSALRRTKIGAYHVKKAIGPKTVTEKNFEKKLFQKTPTPKIHT